MISKLKPQNYFVVSAWMIQDLNLSGNELMVYAIIHGFNQDGVSKFCGSLKYLQEFTGASRTTVIKALDDLVNKELLVEEKVIGKGNTYKTTPVQKLYHPTRTETGPVPVQKPDGGGTETIPPTRTETVPNNIVLDTISNKNTGADKPPHTHTPEEKQFVAFQKWIEENAPSVAKVKEPITCNQLSELIKKYGKEPVKEVLMDMHNKPDLTKKYTSASRTANNWLKRNNGTAPAPIKASPIYQQPSTSAPLRSINDL